MSQEIVETKTNIDEQQHQQPSAETKNTDNQQVSHKVPYERFKEKVDEVNALKAQLAELKKAQEEAEKKRLEEQNEYKKLYEKAVKELEEFKRQTLNAKKDALLAKAGYDDEQIRVLRNTLTGETDEELAQSIEQVKAVFPPKPKYVDPSLMNGIRQEPEPKDISEIGVKQFEKIKSKLFPTKK